MARVSHKSVNEKSQIGTFKYINRTVRLNIIKIRFLCISPNLAYKEYLDARIVHFVYVRRFCCC